MVSCKPRRLQELMTRVRFALTARPARAALPGVKVLSFFSNFIAVGGLRKLDSAIIVDYYGSCGLQLFKRLGHWRLGI